ncbi:MAG: PatB family C-S lyase [Pseudomonadales bacterium]
MDFDFDQRIDRRSFWSTKWTRYPPDVLPFWVADMDFRAPESIIDALRERVEHGIYGYTNTPNTVVQACLDWLNREFSWEIDPEWLVWLPGVVPAFNMACRLAGSPGTEVMIPVPVYHPFLAAPRHAQREAVFVDLKENERGWCMDFDAMEAAVTARTRMCLVCNPQNPTGRVYTAQELTQLGEFAARHDLLICSDEIHCAIILDATKSHTPIATLDRELAKRTITLMAPTKTFNIPGVGCAFAIIEDTELRDRFRTARAGLVSGIGPLQFTACDAAFREQGAWLPALLDYLRGNRDLLERTVAGIAGISMRHVEATFLGWIDTRELELDGPGAFFEQHGLGFSNGADFGKPGFVRFNFACPRSLLREGLERLEAAVSKARSDL